MTLSLRNLTIVAGTVGGAYAGYRIENGDGKSHAGSDTIATATMISGAVLGVYALRRGARANAVSGALAATPWRLLTGVGVGAIGGALAGLAVSGPSAPHTGTAAGTAASAGSGDSQPSTQSGLSGTSEASGASTVGSFKVLVPGTVLIAAETPQRPATPAVNPWKGNPYHVTPYRGPVNPVTQADVVHDIAWNFQKAGMSPLLGVATGIIESGLRPDAHQDVGDGAVGLFQTFTKSDETGGAGRGAGLPHRDDILMAQRNSPVSRYYPSGEQISDAVTWFKEYGPLHASLSEIQLAAWASNAQGQYQRNVPRYERMFHDAAPRARMLIARDATTN